MKQIPLRLFQQKATQYLDDLPIALTRYNRVVCYVYSDMNNTATKATGNTLSIKNIEDAKKAVNSKPVQTCKHGYPISICQSCRKK